MNIKPKTIYKRLVFILGLCYNIIKGVKLWINY